MRRIHVEIPVKVASSRRSVAFISVFFGVSSMVGAAAQFRVSKDDRKARLVVQDSMQLLGWSSITANLTRAGCWERRCRFMAKSE